MSIALADAKPASSAPAPAGAPTQNAPLAPTCPAQTARGRRLLGVLPDIHRDPLATLTRLAREYGDTIWLPLGPQRVLMLNAPASVEHVLLRRRENYRKSDYYARVRPAFGNGLILADGAEWKQQRQAAQPAFHRDRVTEFAAMTTKLTQNLLAGWAEPPKRPVDIADIMMRLALQVVTTALFGSAECRDSDQIIDSVKIIMQEAERRMWTLFDMPMGVPTPANRRLSGAVRRLEAVLQAMIDEQRRIAVPGSLLSTLIHQPGKPQPDDAALLAQAKTFLVAGHETTGSALGWILFLLSKHPEIRLRVEAETDRVLDGRPPAFDDINRLPHIRQVALEAMRLYPPAWTMSRTAIEADRIGDTNIPAGTNIMLAPYVIHRDPRLWENPEGFDPERFSPDSIAARPPGAYFPFGLGARRCIGETMAMTELVLIIAALSQRFRLDLVPGLRVEPIPQISLRPGPSMMMNIHSRPIKNRD